MIPCYNRPDDLRRLLDDLAHVEFGRPGKVEFRILVVDNASDPALRDLAVPEGLDVEILRLSSNAGGSGGFNAGISEAISRPLAGQEADFLWLIDSDARVERTTLAALLRVMEDDPSVAAAGSALVDPATGDVHETGGRLNRRSGQFQPAIAGPAPDERPVPVDYVAACSALVRREAIVKTGLMPDVFLNADDVEWFLRMSRRAGRVVAAPASRAVHPPMYRRTGAAFERFLTWPRYYIARNAFGPIDAAGLGRRVRLVRALREVGRAVLMAMLGRPDLSRLHLLGLRDAAAGRRTGPAPAGLLHVEKPRPLAELPDVLAAGAGGRMFIHGGLPPAAAAHFSGKDRSDGLSAGTGLTAVASAAARLLFGPTHDLAVVPANGRHECWARGRMMAVVAPDGFVVRTSRARERLRLIASALRIGGRGVWLSVRIAAGAGRRAAAPLVPVRQAPGMRPDTPTLTLAIIVLSYNRWPALERTLRALSDAAATAPAGVRPPRIVVVDNASTDGTPQRVRERFPQVELVALDENRGAGAFNVGAAAAADDLVLILDDDARPDPEALCEACQLLSRRPDLAAVALHPRHPSTGESEWPFAQRLGGPVDDWPVMGCGNLVRREAWERVGGYDDEFFLYRNDADLAMKILAAGWGVHFNPEWVVWHDSPCAARKSARWFELATRNWMWLCRRHGRGAARPLAMGAGCLWAHKLAGLHLPSHIRILRGCLRGLLERPPELPASCEVDGRAVQRLLRLRLAGRRGRGRR